MSAHAPTSGSSSGSSSASSTGASVTPLNSRREEPLAQVSMRTTFQQMHGLSRSEPAPTVAQRRAHLDKLEAAIRRYQPQIIEAIDADFGGRSRYETVIADIFPLILSLQHTRKHLARWAKPRSAPVHWAFQPASAEVIPQPLGVVGIISPWNYPIQLALSPLISALAAGNRALIKPSELTPRSSALLAQLVAETFAPEHVTVIQGGVDIAEAFGRLPFDHLIFTGSTRIGALVMRAAADNLTPVTLELGGKSPAIVHPDHPLEHAVDRILAGKMLNAGQTCIAPDYVLLGRGKAREFVEHARAIVARRYPTLLDNPDYTAVVNDRQYQRLTSWLQDAEAKGALLLPLNPAEELLPAERRKLPLTLVLNPTEDMAVMQEELFGPILPLVEVDNIEAAIRYVNDHPRPLALYYFDRDKSRARELLGRTVAGDVTVNDTMLHIVQEELPFGGVGPAGMGAYHGKRGFDTFSHLKGVFWQSRLNAAGLMSPPYGKRLDQLLSVLMS